MESVSAQGTQSPRRGTGASRFGDGGHDGNAGEVEGEIGGDTAHGFGQPVLSGEDPRARGILGAHDAERLLGHLHPEGREAIARLEQRLLSRVLEKEDRALPRGVGSRGEASSRGERAALFTAASAMGRASRWKWAGSAHEMSS